MKIYQSLKLLIIPVLLFLSQVAYSDTTITTTNNDNTSTIINIPDVGPDTITTAITPSVLSSSTVTIQNEDGSTASTTITAPVTPGVDTPSTTTISTQEE
jgi:hypothetical protein